MARVYVTFPRHVEARRQSDRWGDFPQGVFPQVFGDGSDRPKGGSESWAEDCQWIRNERLSEILTAHLITAESRSIILYVMG